MREKTVRDRVADYWDAVLSQDRERMREFFRDGAFVNWHNTDEHFTAEAFIEANCRYPGKWGGNIERTECIGDLTVSAVHVVSKDAGLSFHVTSFVKWDEEGMILSADEYWGDDGDAPEWRRELGLSVPILTAAVR